MMQVNNQMKRKMNLCIFNFDRAKKLMYLWIFFSFDKMIAFNQRDRPKPTSNRLFCTYFLIEFTLHCWNLLFQVFQNQFSKINIA